MLIQAHWQNRTDPTQTEFIAQAEFDDGEKALAWAQEVFERRKDECPEGWVPLVCTEGSPPFVHANPAP